ncbi:MAG: hypothetical protein V1865_02125 [bacterium]
MGIFLWKNSRIKNFTILDIKLIKLSTAAIILMVVVLWPPLASLDWYWYLIIGVLAAIRPMIKFYK